MGNSSELIQEKKESNKIESKDKFKNLKSNYILKKLFNHLLKNKSLDIIKYNNNIKNRMNISIKDYKECSEKYSSIEIEIKPVKNKYGKFIIRKENENYYHIYFNNNKKEIKRNYLYEKENVAKLKIILDYKVKSFEGLFEDCKCIEYIYFTKFKRNNINNMGSMFYGCSSLKELNLSNFKTDNVINMGFMFCNCSSLKELNLSNFNTNNATDMEYMFYGCSSLKALNLSNFNTNNVTNMNYMFYNCYSLKELNIPNFNTNNVYNMRYMFSKCSMQLQNKIKDQYKNIKEEAFDKYETCIIH